MSLNNFLIARFFPVAFQHPAHPQVQQAHELCPHPPPPYVWSGVGTTYVYGPLQPATSAFTHSEAFHVPSTEPITSDTKLSKRGTQLNGPDRSARPWCTGHAVAGE